MFGFLGINIPHKSARTHKFHCIKPDIKATLNLENSYYILTEQQMKLICIDCINNS